MMREVMMILVVAVLMLVPVGSSLAQGGMPHEPYCGDLSEEDCAILVQSQEAMLTLYASAFDMTMDFAFEADAPDFESFAMGFAVTGDGEVTPELLAMMAQPQEMEDLESMMAMGPEMFLDMLGGVKANVMLELDLPAELMAEADMPFETLPPIDLRYVDGVAYFNLGAFMPAEEAEGMPAWMGIDLAAMYEGIFEMMDEEMMGEAMPGMDEIEGMMMDPELMTQFADPEFLADFLTITRLEDQEVMGQVVAVFQTDFDYAMLYGSETFQTFMDEYMEMVMTMQGEEMAAEELPENFSDIIAALLSQLDLQVVEWIGLDDNYMHRIEVTLDFALDFEQLLAEMPELADDPDISDAPDSFAMTMGMVFELSAFNESVEVEVPEGAMVIDPMMFMGMEGESY